MPKRFELSLTHLGQRKYRYGKMYWMAFPWHWPKVTAVALSYKKKMFVCTMRWKLLIQPIQHLVAIPPWYAYYLNRFWKNPVGNIFCGFFYDVVFQGQTRLDISQEWLVRLTWNKKEIHWLDSGSAMWPWPLTSTMTMTLDFSSSNVEIAVSQELLSDYETKKKQIK